MSKMKIKVQEIGPEGQTVSYRFEPGWLRQAVPDMEVELGPQGAGAELTLEKIGRDVLARGGMQGQIRVPCARCLAPAFVALPAQIQMTYSERSSAPGEAESGQDDLDVDFTPFDGVEIDLGELFREQIILAIPMTALCRADCKGLCSQCGKDLNEGPCDCKQPTDPRLEALRGLKLSH